MSGSIAAEAGARSRPAVAGPLPRGALRARVGRIELAAMLAVVALAALLRLAGLPTRGGWDSDQAVEMFALRGALASGRLPVFGPEAISVGGSFHHGALYYDLLLPAAWLGNGDPTFVAFEIAVAGLLVVPMVWWIARTIGGPLAGLVAALLAAVSASLIAYSTLIWNPAFVEPGAALACLGAWQAWRTRRGGWWIAAAAGLTIATQSHLAAGVLVLPLGATYLLGLRRASPAERRRLLLWGVAAAGLVVATYLPLLLSELASGFAETRAIGAFFGAPSDLPVADPLTRVFFGGIRILAWPLTGWPLVGLRTAIGPAFLVAMATAAGLVWLVLPNRRARAAAEDEQDSRAEESPLVENELAGRRLVAGWLAVLGVALGLGLKELSQLQRLPTEQYHFAADPLVIVATALVLTALWGAGGSPRARTAARAAAAAALAGLVAWNAVRWPPLVAPDGGWPAAQVAARQIERDAAGGSLAMVPLFAAKGTDAYAYPLALDGVALGPAASARTVVVLCDSGWLEGCGGPAEEAWLTSAPAGRGLRFVERIAAAPDRILSVYRR